MLVQDSLFSTLISRLSRDGMIDGFDFNSTWKVGLLTFDRISNLWQRAVIHFPRIRFSYFPRVFVIVLNWVSSSFSFEDGNDFYCHEKVLEWVFSSASLYPSPPSSVASASFSPASPGVEPRCCYRYMKIVLLITVAEDKNPPSFHPSPLCSSDFNQPRERFIKNILTHPPRPLLPGRSPQTATGINLINERTVWWHHRHFSSGLPKRVPLIIKLSPSRSIGPSHILLPPSLRFILRTCSRSGAVVTYIVCSYRLVPFLRYYDRERGK